MFMSAWIVLYTGSALIGWWCWHTYWVHAAVVAVVVVGSGWEGAKRYRAMAAVGWTEISGYTAVVETSAVQKQTAEPNLAAAAVVSSAF